MSRKLTVLADRALNVPSRNRLDPDNKNYAAIIAAHDAALANKHDGYIDPVNSLFVITAATHAARGYCCDNNCRHCPYTE
ncbi:MAG: DUF5522 domain-containing protein [Actinomycetota bacterium]|jgi:hypothetical protein|nr:hypothetical protein [Actinomycetota bacterium]